LRQANNGPPLASVASILSKTSARPTQPATPVPQSQQLESPPRPGVGRRRRPVVRIRLIVCQCEPPLVDFRLWLREVRQVATLVRRRGARAWQKAAVSKGCSVARRTNEKTEQQQPARQRRPLAGVAKAEQHPDLSRSASEYLVEQRRLVQLQIKHFDEERRLAIAAAKRKRYADRIRNTLSTLVALIVLGLVVAISRMTIEASTITVSLSRISPCRPIWRHEEQVASPGRESGQPVGAIRSTANRNSLSFSDEVRADQAASVKIEIPQTGVSLDELERFVHRWLGHQIYVNGKCAMSRTAISRSACASPALSRLR